MQKPPSKPIIKRIATPDTNAPATELVKEKERRFSLGNIKTGIPRFSLGRIQTLLPKFELGSIQTSVSSPFKKKNQTGPDSAKSAGRKLAWLRIVPQEGEIYSNSKLLKLLSIIDGEGFCWRYYCDEKDKLQILVGCSSQLILAVKKAIETVFGQVDLEELNGDPFPDFPSTGLIKRVGPLGKGLKTKVDNAIEDLLINLAGTSCCIDITFSRASESDRKNMLRSELGSKSNEPSSKTTEESMWDVINFRKKTPKVQADRPKAQPKESVEEKARRKAIESELLTSEMYFNVTIAIHAAGAPARSIIQSVAGVLDTTLRDGHRLLLEGAEGNKGAPVTLWKETELLPIIGLPNMAHRVANRIPSLKSGQKKLGDNELNHGIAVGRAHHPTQEGRLVYIPLGQFLKHFVLTGKTGAGKSSTAVQMIQSIIDQWIESPDEAPGFTYIDPAQATLTIILNRLLQVEKQGKKVPWEKVHYFSLGPSDFPIGLNLLHREKGESISDTADTVLALLKYAYGGDTPRMDRLIRNALLTLLEDTETHNVLGIVPVLINKAFREEIHVTDPMVKQFWKTTGENISSDALEPILNRLSPFTSNPEMRNLFGQSVWTPEIRKWMDEGHIVLFDIKGVKDENLKLICGHLTNRYYAESLMRPEDISKPHILKIDEAHLVQVPALPTIIAVSRKFGLSLGLITQYVDQFNNALVKSISENIGTILSCKQGKDSAPKVAEMTNNGFEASYLKGLQERVVAVYTEVKNEAGRNTNITFTAESDPPVIYMPNGLPANYSNRNEMQLAQEWARQKAMELMKRDSRSRKDVEEEILDYLVMVEDGLED